MRKNVSDFFLFVITLLLMLWGGLSAIHGLLQLYGIMPSHYSGYTPTGQFLNPGPYSGFLAMILPLAVDCSFQSRGIRKTHSFIVYGFSNLVIALIICVLPAGMSRAAWLASVCSCCLIVIGRTDVLRNFNDFIKKHSLLFYILLSLGIGLLIVLACNLYSFKPDSANGRLFIWKIVCCAIAEHPFSGHGDGCFAQAYGAAQEMYFANANYAEWEEYVAGAPTNAFNEYLQLAVEYGIPFMLLIIVLLVSNVFYAWKSNCLGYAAALVSFMLFALASYPLQTPIFPFALTLILVGCIFSALSFRSRKYNVIVTILTILYCSQIIYDGVDVYRREKRNDEAWRVAASYYDAGLYDVAIKHYQELLEEHHDMGDFLFEFGHALHCSEKYSDSNRILLIAERYSCDPMILNIIGKNYQALQEYERAESYFLRSINRIPSRIYPYYLLARLYAQPEFYHPEKCAAMKQIVLTKRPKTMSPAILEMREEVNRLD